MYNEITDPAIKAIWLQVGSQTEWDEYSTTLKDFVREAIKADRELRQEEQEPVATIDQKMVNGIRWLKGKTEALSDGDKLYAAALPAKVQTADTARLNWLIETGATVYEGEPSRYHVYWETEVRFSGVFNSAREAIDSDMSQMVQPRPLTTEENGIMHAAQRDSIQIVHPGKLIPAYVNPGNARRAS